MFYVPFWILIGIFVLMAAVAIKSRGFRFLDLQVLIAVVAVSLFYDMIFCKWLEYYSYVVKYPLKAYYSLIFCVIGYPAISITFLKFLPSSWRQIILYIAIWTAALTLIEILFAEPYRIVIYSKWRIIPYSPIIYIISFTWEYGYYKILQRRMQIEA